MKKSIYIFLTGLLGSLLFLILERILAFIYFLLLTYNYAQFSFGHTLTELLAFDYFILIIALLLGGWYGVWVGMYWYEAVYESTGGGFVGHILRHYWPVRQPAYNLQAKVAQVEDKLDGDLWQLEDLAKKVEVKSKVAVKKRIVRKK